MSNDPSNNHPIADGASPDAYNTATRRDVLRTTAIAAGAGVALSVGTARAQELSVPEPATQGPPTPLPTSTALQFFANHAALRVVDLEESVDWWGRVMGAVEVRRSEIDPINEGAEIALMHINQGFHIELIGGGQIETPEGLPPADIGADYQLAGWKHIGFYVADADATIAHLRGQGVEPTYDTINEGYGVRILLIQDPNGYFVEFYAPLPREGQ